MPGLRLADDLELTVRLERPADPVEDEPMVVGDHHSHGSSVAQACDGNAGEPPLVRGIAAPRVGDTVRLKGMEDGHSTFGSSWASGEGALRD